VANLLPELDATVSFERVRLGWMGPIVLEGVKVVPADGREPPVFIRRIEGDHGLLTMLLSGGDLGRFVIEDPTIQLAFDQDHGTNLEQLFRTSDAPPIVERLPQRRRAAVSVRIDVE
jgi:hypothetical protein